MKRKYIYTIFSFLLLIGLLFFNSVNLKAESIFESDILERMELIQASQKLEKEKNAIPTNTYALFLTDFATDGGEANLGMKVEIDFPEKVLKNNKNKWRYTIEGIYLKSEADSVVFFSLKRLFKELYYSPYFGVGAELTDRANYQLFNGLYIMNNFYIESKIINEEGDFKDSKFYSVCGYQINF